MLVILAALKAKVTQIEQEIVEIRQGLEHLAAVAAPRAQEPPRAAVQSVDKGEWQEWFAKWFHHIGITVQPMGAEKSQVLMLQEGVRPEENLLSHGIIAMREE